MHYLPIAFPFYVALFLFLMVVVILIEIGILEYAYEKIGIKRRYVFGLLFMSLVGGYVNIPVYQLPPHEVAEGGRVSYFGMQYMIPFVREWPGTVIAVNLGGAVIPSLLSIYLIIKNRLFLTGLAGVAIVTAVVHMTAQSIRGVGIAEPLFIPFLASAFSAILLSRKYAAALAYISGTLGTLIGADILNLNKVAESGAPVASIGGAGTFDGIFLTGIAAVLLASLFTKTRLRTDKKGRQEADDAA